MTRPNVDAIVFLSGEFPLNNPIIGVLPRPVDGNNTHPLRLFILPPWEGKTLHFIVEV